jgi:sugar phosphate isomerase/epimerase
MRKEIDIPMLKIGLCLSPTKPKSAPLLYQGDILKGLESAGKYGYDGVELSLLDSQKLDRGWLIEKLRELNLEAFAIATAQTYSTDGYSLYSRHEEKRQQAIKRISAHIDFASRLNAMVIIGGIRGKLTGPAEDWNTQREKGSQALVSCVRSAEKKGVTLLLEPINRHETNLFNTVEQALELVEEMGSKYLRLLIDTFHMNIEESSIVGSILMAGSHLGYVHFADNNRLAPGWGHIDFSQVLSGLKEIGYQGPISVEVLPEPDDDRASEQAIQHIRSLFQTEVKA